MVVKFGINIDVKGGGGTPGRTILTKVMCVPPFGGGQCETVMGM